MRKVPTGQVWSDLQGPRTFGGWHPCLGPERSTGAGDLEVGARNCTPEVPDVFTRRAVFSLCGKLVGHLPVCGWTRAATGTIKRRTSAVTKSWDDETTDDLLVRMVKETIARVKQDDPAKGDWCV